MRTIATFKNRISLGDIVIAPNSTLNISDEIYENNKTVIDNFVSRKLISLSSYIADATIDSANDVLNLIVANGAHTHVNMTSLNNLSSLLSAKEDVGIASEIMSAHLSTFDHSNFLSKNGISGSFTTTNAVVTVVDGSITIISAI